VIVYGDKAKVLIVDDSSNIRRLVSVVLGSVNYDIIEASDGEKALSMIMKHGPDIVIMDVSLPKMNGLYVCEVLRNDEKTKNIPILILTSETSNDVKAKAAKCADNLMHKPFEPELLRAEVKSLLARSRQS
jgi:DNA-binding response OmpR family regulator